MTAPFWEENLLLRVVCGSRAYGLATAESDTDTRGVCVPPKRVLLGLQRFEQHESERCDHVTYALAKFARLALEGNPNIIETLYTPADRILFVSDLGQRLIDARELTLSRRVGQRFMGYAQAQRQRMERHRRWIVAPPGAEPRPEAFGGRDEAGRVRWPSSQAEKAYKAAHKKWRQYRDWRANRNPARAALEERHGYDTKHAMHLCRLVTMGEEVLRDGEVRVHRPDADWLREVRAGALGYDELLAWVDERVARLPALTAASPLPDEPDAEAFEAVVIEVQERFHFGR